MDGALVFVRFNQEKGRARQVSPFRQPVPFPRLGLGGPTGQLHRRVSCAAAQSERSGQRNKEIPPPQHWCAGGSLAGVGARATSSGACQGGAGTYRQPPAQPHRKRSLGMG